MVAVYKKELRSYFSNMTGYISIALLLAMMGIFVKFLNLDSLYPYLEYSLPSVALILLVAVPIITMRSFAEERGQRTDILLYTLPLSTLQIVLGKYFAMLTVFAVPTGIICLYPLILSIYGSVNFLSTYASILAFFLLCAAMIAICMFASSLTESQVIAAVLGIGALVLCYTSTIIADAVPDTAIASFIAFTVLVVAAALIVYWFVKSYWIAFASGAVLEAVLIFLYIIDSASFAGLFREVIYTFSIFDALNEYVNNQLIDLTVLVYYLSISFLFCFLTVQTVEKRRWN